ncbi:TPA: CopG family ribbon-helix-helix protein [Candidatus Micrarchaeota archaeon]|nr:CopG family ribbon-helix-helix protein [Candidatus Micrarchaeota archaeon]HIH29967.1 CopG family ribbon-helix-helix protein [Candidatus Micrarchaeota archaeon]
MGGKTKIISISLPWEALREVDGLKSQLGFSGRSEAIRAGIRTLVSENREREKLSGKVKCVLLLVHSEKSEDKATELKHKFEDVISTQIHSSLSAGKCMEVFLMDGDAERIKKLVKGVQSNKKIDYFKLVVP